MAHSEKASELPPGHYRVHVDTYYESISSRALEREWGRGCVASAIYNMSFRAHAACRGIDEWPGVRIFYLYNQKHRGFSMAFPESVEDAVHWGQQQRTEVAPNGYRPATVSELRAFVRAFPRSSHYVVPGSYVEIFGGPKLMPAVAWNDGDRPLFADAGYERLNHNQQVLFVVCS